MLNICDNTKIGLKKQHKTRMQGEFLQLWLFLFIVGPFIKKSLRTHARRALP